MTEHQGSAGASRRGTGPSSDTNEDAFRHAQDEIASRLRDRGVRLTGTETGDDLADLLDAVERFEGAVELAGGDLMLDEPVGSAAPIQPDNAEFVMPRRNDGETVAAYIDRLAAASQRVRGKRGD